MLLSAARGKRPSGIPGAPDTVACGPSPREDRQATPSLEIIKTRFWPVIHSNTMANTPSSPGPGSLKTQKQDFLGLGLGLEEGWGWRREIQESAASLSRRNPHNNSNKNVQAASWWSVACLWNTCSVSGPMGHNGDQADLAPVLREPHLHGGNRHQRRKIPLRQWVVLSVGRRDVGTVPPQRGDFELRPEGCVGRAWRRGRGRGG